MMRISLSQILMLTSKCSNSQLQSLLLLDWHRLSFTSNISLCFSARCCAGIYTCSSSLLLLSCLSQLPRSIRSWWLFKLLWLATRIAPKSPTAQNCSCSWFSARVVTQHGQCSKVLHLRRECISLLIVIPVCLCASLIFGGHQSHLPLHASQFGGHQSH